MRLPAEQEIQNLKAQEAKDLCIELLNELRLKERGPISPSEVQVKELEYTLRLRDAEAADRRAEEQHQLRIKELELQIEQEKTSQAEAERKTDDLRRQYSEIFTRVESAQEAMNIALERATREHALKLEQLESQYVTRQQELQASCEQLEQEKQRRSDEIVQLSALQDSAVEIEQLRSELEARKAGLDRQIQTLDEEYESAEFERSKRLKDLQRQHELEAAELAANHKKRLLELDREAVDPLLNGLNLVAVDRPTWEQLQQQSQQQQIRDEQELQHLRDQAQEALRREYNITSSQPLDVTELFYDHRTLSREVEALRDQLQRQDAEIKRMREHIEQEPVRISRAVEAAKVHVQNTIGQAGSK